MELKILICIEILDRFSLSLKMVIFYYYMLWIVSFIQNTQLKKVQN